MRITNFKTNGGNVVNTIVFHVSIVRGSGKFKKENVISI